MIIGNGKHIVPTFLRSTWPMKSARGGDIRCAQFDPYAVLSRFLLYRGLWWNISRWRALRAKDGRINLISRVCLCAQKTATTTTEDTPVFDRSRVSLDIPSTAFSTGFNLVTDVSKVLNSVILVSIISERSDKAERNRHFRWRAPFTGSLIPFVCHTGSCLGKKLHSNRDQADLALHSIRLNRLTKLD